MADDEAKLRELVLYIAKRTQDDLDFGRTKLAKVLYYTDFRAYRDHGEPVTGAVYERRKHGPFPRLLKQVELHLQARKRARLLPSSDKYEPSRIVPLDEPDTSHFAPWQLALVDYWIDRIQPLTADEASDISHAEPGWMLAGEERAEIPLSTARISRRAPTVGDFKQARELIREHGWP